MADRLWVGGTDGDWGTAANWDPAAVPLAGENVFITSGSVDIDAFDASGTDIGIVTIGAQYKGNIGSLATGYLILSCAASKRIVIDGNPVLLQQAIWIDYNSANATNIDLSSFGGVVESDRGSFGVHIKRTAGACIMVNSGGMLTLDTGGFTSLADTGTARSQLSTGATLTLYHASSASVVSTLVVLPSSTLTVATGTVNVTAPSTDSILLVEQFGGIINWNSGATIGTQLTARGGTFTTLNAPDQSTIADIEVYNEAFLDLTLASITNNIEIHGQPTIIYPASSQAAIS